MKVKINGTWSEHRPIGSYPYGYRYDKIKLNGDDIKELAGLKDQTLCDIVRNLSGQLNRKGDSSFTKFQTPRSKVNVKITNSLVSADFAEVENRVAKMMGIPNAGRRAAVFNGRQYGKTMAAALQSWKNMMLEQSIQQAVDEEGCGAVFAAAKQWE